MWDQGSKGWDRGSEGWDQGSEGWDQGSEGWDLRSQPWAQGSQTMGSGSAVFLGIRDQAVSIFVGSGTKMDHAFGIKDQKFCVQKWDQRRKKHTSLPP